MKKIMLLIITLTITLLGCQSPEPANVIVPNGVPSIAQAYMEYHTDNHLFEIERVNGPQPLVAAFTSESHDIIIAPINQGANLYQKGSPYQLAAVLTWSNLQIISRTEIISISDLEGNDIIAFGEGAVPQMIIDYLFDSIEFNQEVNIQYDAASPQESLATFMQDEEAIVIVSEPVTTSAKDMVEDIYVLDLADVWTEYTDENLFPQAGIFVHKDLTNNQVMNYLNLLEESAHFANEDPFEIAEMCESLSYPFEKTTIADAIPQSQINYQSIDEVKEIVESFISMIYDYKPELIGDGIPDDEWYYPLS